MTKSISIEFTPELKIEVDKTLKKFFESSEAKKFKEASLKASLNRKETIEKFKRVFERSNFKKHPVLLKYVLEKIPDFV